MLVTGDREVADSTVSVRSRSGGDLGPRSVDAFITDALDEIKRKDVGAPAPSGEKQPA
jgi:threonyl-tRNA synthetase